MKKFKECLIKRSVKDLSVTTMILAFSGIFSYGVVFDQLPPATLTNILIAVTSNKSPPSLLIILMLVAFGMFMETTVYHSDLYTNPGSPDSAVWH